MPSPMPMIGPIRGYEHGPIMTAVELVLSPSEAISIANDEYQYIGTEK